MSESVRNPGMSQFYHPTNDPIKLSKQTKELIEIGEQLLVQILKLQSSKEESDQLTSELLQMNLKNLYEINVSPLVINIEQIILHGEINTELASLLKSDMSKLLKIFAIHQIQ